MERRLDKVERRLERRFSGVEDRLEEIDDYLDQVDSHLSDAMGDIRASRRYGTEERRKELEKLQCQLKRDSVDMQTSWRDRMNDMEKETGDKMAQLQEDMDQRLRGVEEAVEKKTWRKLNKALENKLANASLRVEGVLVFEI